MTCKVMREAGLSEEVSLVFQTEHGLVILGSDPTTPDREFVVHLCGPSAFGGSRSFNK